MIFESNDNCLLYCESHTVKKPKASMLVVHGVGEHCGRYSEFTEYLNRMHVDVHLLDLRGHGRSDGVRGHVDDFSYYYGDLEAWLGHLEKSGGLNTEMPCFLFGHSLGGLIATGFLAQYKRGPLSVDIKGLILSNPAFGIYMNPLRVLEKQIAKKLPVFLRGIQVPSGIDPALLSHDETVVEAYKNDPLVHTWVTPGLFASMLRAMKGLPKTLASIRVPVLFLLSGKDKIVNVEAAERYAQRLEAAHAGNVTVRHFHGFFHEIFNEVKRERAYLELKKWILTCLHPQKKASSRKGLSKSSAREAIAKGTSL